jgi:hypothetical protein
MAAVGDETSIPEVRMTQQRSIFLGGFTTMLRHWPALVWTYVFNVSLAFFFTMPLHNQMASLTANSLESERLVGGFDLGVAGSVLGHLSINQGSAAPASYLSIWVFVLIYFMLVPGVLFCYQTDAPARLSTLLQTGLMYFWRFVRITLVSFVFFGVVLGVLFAIQGRWAAHVDETSVGRAAWLHEMAGIVVIGLVAAFLRVYFDLVEVYTVQLGFQAPVVGMKANMNRRIRRVLLPAWRTYRRNFFRVYLSFVFLTLLGLSAVVVTARIAMHSLAQPRMWPMFLLAQIGLFLMLLTRFWQRGAETVLAQENALAVAVVVVAEPVVTEPLVVGPEAA